MRVQGRKGGEGKPSPKDDLKRNEGSANFIRPKGPCGSLFQFKIQSIYATRSPPTLLTRSGYTCSSTKHSRRNSVVPTNQGNGTQGDQMGPKGGTQGRLRRPLGGWAQGGLWGYSEAIPNGKPFRMESMESNYEWKTIPISKPFQGCVRLRKAE